MRRAPSFLLIDYFFYKGSHGKPLQYSYLENLTGKGASWAIVHGIAKSWTWLKSLSTHARTPLLQVYNKWELLSTSQWLFLKFSASYIFIVSIPPKKWTEYCLYRRGNWDAEKLNYLPKMVAEIQIPCTYTSTQRLAWPHDLLWPVRYKQAWCKQRLHKGFFFGGLSSLQFFLLQLWDFPKQPGEGEGGCPEDGQNQDPKHVASVDHWSL